VSTSAQRAAGPSLDRTGPVWRTVLPALGAIAVAADGQFSVVAELPDADGGKTRALTHGWGELLSHARLGHSLALGAAVVPADDPNRVLLVCGDAHDVAAVVLDLSSRGWRLLSDRPTPTVWRNEQLIAISRPAPLVVSQQRAEAAGLYFTPVRLGSTAVVIDIKRETANGPIDALVQVQRRRPGEPPFDLLTGHRRFERAANLMLGGALAPDIDTDPSAVIDHVRLATIRAAVARIDSATDDAVDHLVRWWAR
jgi:hypothetical protein